MSDPQIVSSVIGLAISAIILLLVRRDHLQPKQAFRWFFVAAIIAILGMFPSLIDALGVSLGIAYPPIIPLIIGLCAALVKILLMDIERNKMNVTQDRIVQKLSILEAEIEELRKNSSACKKSKQL